MQQLPKGDIPINLLTDQSIEEIKYPLQSKQNLMEAVQSQSSFKPQLYKNQDLYEEFIRKIETKKPHQKHLQWRTNIHLRLDDEQNQLQQIVEELKVNYQYPRLVIRATFLLQNKEIKPSSRKRNKENNPQNVWDRLSKMKGTYQTSQSLQLQPQSTGRSQRHTPERVEAISNRPYEEPLQPIKFNFNYQDILVGSPQTSFDILLKNFMKVQQMPKFGLRSFRSKFNQIDFKIEIENDLCLLTIDELAITFDHLSFAPYQAQIIPMQFNEQKSNQYFQQQNKANSQTNELAYKYRARVQSQITDSKPISINYYDHYISNEKRIIKIRR